MRGLFLFRSHALRDFPLQATVDRALFFQFKALAQAHGVSVNRALERGETGVTVESLVAILAPLEVSLGEFFRPFGGIVRLRTPRRR